ncbi:unnamed protein product [Moneuplotes crassus]|uniref:Uncharacterized protein n=1 Tax=Euplotes crassus TaxID=5936 RepID=A0AAD1XTA8_EUPCR|nr:unnamed protein product [Moneuplotes crassus]
MEDIISEEKNIESSLNDLMKTLPSYHLRNWSFLKQYAFFDPIVYSRDAESFTNYSKVEDIVFNYTKKYREITKLKKACQNLKKISSLKIIGSKHTYTESLKIYNVYPLLYKVTRFVSFDGMKIQRKCFQRIFAICNKTEEICFIDCIIMTKGFDLSEISESLQFGVKKLEFYLCADPERQDGFPNKFEKVFYSILRSNLRNSLEEVEITATETYQHFDDEVEQEYDSYHIKLKISHVRDI